ncbi:lamin-B1-like [Lytechinus variegatus]|uniref:lamin-B1-like n=1 Tax=Lytechinus variegatus TaxID=7654 RepID=UPI001BB13616|nr:lamin-B1-like [Lytechinus variegatus]
MMKRQRKRNVEKKTSRVISSTPRFVSTSYSATGSSEEAGDASSSLLSPISSSTFSTSTMATRTSTSSSRRSTSSSSSSRSFVRQENEREEMVALNDRLAEYIDLVNELNLDSSRAQILDISITEARNTAMTDIREIFEKELADARRLHADERERLERECAKYKSELSDIAPRLKSAEKERNEARKRLADLEPRISEKDTRIRYLEDELNRVKSDLNNKDKQLKSAKLEIENGDIIRKQLEKKIRDLEKDLELQEEYYKKQLEKAEGAWDETLQGEWEKYIENLNVSLFEDLRQVREQEMAQVTEETELTRLLTRIKGFGVSEFASELRKLKTDINMKDQNDTLVARILDLEAQLRKEREAHIEALSARDREIEEVKEMVAVRVREYNDLLRIKLSLDKEIATYRALLDGGVARLRKRTALSDSIQESSYPRIQPSTKRRRVNDEVQVTKSSTTSGLVSIVDTDSDGNFIKLLNQTDSNQSIGGWELQRIVDGALVSTYTFNNRFSLNPEHEVTVWASGSEDKVQNSPSDVVSSDTENWGKGFSTETILLRPDGEVMAKCDELREHVNNEIVESSAREFRPCVVM